MKHVSGKPLVLLFRKLKAKREFRLFRFGLNRSTKGTYKLTPESAAALMATYKERDLKITFDYDHNALKSGKDARPGDGIGAGKCDLELRDDGVWCTNVEWTPNAQKAIEDGEWVYFSPAFLPNEETKEILELVNIALTNIPALDGIEPLAANRASEGEHAAKFVIKHEGSKWVLYESDGKTKIAEHPTKEAAEKQEAAINISKARKAGHHIPKPKESNVKHPISEHLKKFVAGGKSLADCAKASGIHADRMKELHDGSGAEPSQEEMKAVGKALSLSDEAMKAMSEEYEDADGNEEKAVGASAIDGQDVDRVEGDDDDDANDVVRKQRRGTEAVELLSFLTGTSDPVKQRARAKAMAEESRMHREDHDTIVALKAERQKERLEALIKRGKDEGKLTPKLIKFYSTRKPDELEEFLKVAPIAMNVRSVQAVEGEKEDEAVTGLTVEDREVAKLCHVSLEEFAKRKKASAGLNPLSDSRDRAVELSNRRGELLAMYDQAASEESTGVIAMRKATGLKR